MMVNSKNMRQNLVDWEVLESEAGGFCKQNDGPPYQDQMETDEKKIKDWFTLWLCQT